MSSTVFVDSAAWVALLHRGDSLHERAVEVYRRMVGEGRMLLTISLVLVEVASALVIRAGQIAIFGRGVSPDDDAITEPFQITNALLDFPGGRRSARGRDQPDQVAWLQSPCFHRFHRRNDRPSVVRDKANEALLRCYS